MTTTARPAIAYFRVSSVKQGESGLGLEAQKAAVTAYARTHGLDVRMEYQEVESGTRKRHRPKLDEALEQTRKMEAVLLIAKLDRLSRNLAFIANLLESGVEFRAVDMPNADRMTLQMFAVVAEKEAELISRRTREGLGALKARGVVLGKPENLTLEARRRGGSKMREKAISQMRPAAAYAAHLRREGLSLRDIAEKLTAGGFGTRTGRGPWTAVAVKRILDRTALRSVVVT